MTTAGKERINVFGCLIDNLSMSETLQRVEEFVQAGGPHQHVVVNVDKIVKSRKDPKLLEIINRCDLVNVDGMAVVWASRLLGRPLKERVAGVDLFEKLLERAAERNWGVYLLGGREGVARRVGDLAARRFPGLRVSGFRNGYWTPDEEANVVKDIRESRASLLFVAISSPRKEQFLGRYLREMDVPFAMGVGGSFDVFVGDVSRAPTWMQAAGLEWFHRFLQEPHRMFRRYFVDSLPFFRMVVAAFVRRKLSINGPRDH